MTTGFSGSLINGFLWFEWSICKRGIFGHVSPPFVDKKDTWRYFLGAAQCLVPRGKITISIFHYRHLCEPSTIGRKSVEMGRNKQIPGDSAAVPFLSPIVRRRYITDLTFEFGSRFEQHHPFQKGRKLAELTRMVSFSTINLQLRGVTKIMPICKASCFWRVHVSARKEL